MASRRKSVRPVNKLRHQIMDDKEDVDGNDNGNHDGDDVKVVRYEDREESKARSSNQATPDPASPLGLRITRENTTLELASRSLNYMVMSSASPSAVIGQEPVNHALSPSPSPRPCLAVPSDIFQDFEALKNATQLDTTSLMRRLLQDYTRITNASSDHPPNSRNLNNVINGLLSTSGPEPVAAMTGFEASTQAGPEQQDVMDLSSNSGSSRQNYGQSGFTDDQLAMRDYSFGDKNDTGEEVGKNTNDAAPLDLSMPTKKWESPVLSLSTCVGVVSSNTGKPHHHRDPTNGHCSTHNKPDQYLSPFTSSTYSFSSLSSGSSQSLRSLLNRSSDLDKSLNDSTVLRSASPPLLCKSVSTAPAESYVIDLEPNRVLNQDAPGIDSTNSHGTSDYSTLQYHPTEIQLQLPREKPHIHESIKSSNLFITPISPSMSTKDTSNDVQLAHPTAMELGQSEISKILKMQEPNSCKTDIKAMCTIGPKGNNVKTVQDSFNKKACALPSYSEAVTSLIQSNSHDTAKETSNVSSLQVSSRAFNSHLFCTDQVSLPATEDQIDVRFVPYSSLIQASSLSLDKSVSTNSSEGRPGNPEAPDQQAQRLLLQRILQQQQELFHLSQQGLTATADSPAAQQPSTSSVHQGHQEGATSAINSTALYQNPCIKVFTDNKSHASPAECANENAEDSKDLSEDGVLYTKLISPISETKVPDASQFSLSNTLVDSQNLMMVQLGKDKDKEHVFISPTSENTSGKDQVSAYSGVPTAYLMTSTYTGENGVNGLLAIPFIQGGSLPENFTGLQPFAFAPHPVTPTTQTEQIDSSPRLVPISATLLEQHPQPQQLQLETYPETNAQQNQDFYLRAGEVGNISANNSHQKHSITDDHANQDCFTTGSYSSWSAPPQKDPKLPGQRSKPGRPRGRRGGRGSNGQKSSASKEMKLLTENTLFPGVYTSILKLPWSRRSRSKIKTKPVSQIKKEAQAIALAKEKTIAASLDSAISTENHLTNIKPNSTFVSNSSLSECTVFETSGAKAVLSVPQIAIASAANQGQRDSDSSFSSLSQDKQSILDRNAEMVNKGPRDHKIHFPRLDEVLRQSYAMQRILQGDGNIMDVGEVEREGVEDEEKEVQSASICKSQLFQSTDVSKPSSPNLTPAQFQEALKSSPLSLLSETSPDAVSFAQHENFANADLLTKGSASNVYSKMNRVQASSISVLPSCFGQNKVTDKTKVECKEEKVSDHQSHYSKIFKPLKRRGRPPKSATFISSNFECTDSSTCTLSENAIPEPVVESVSTSVDYSTLLPTANSASSVSTKIAVLDVTNSISSGKSFSATLTGLDAPVSKEIINHLTEEMTLEKKISLLTHQIGLEMSHSLLVSNQKQQRSENCLVETVDMGQTGKGLIRDSEQSHEFPEQSSALVKMLSHQSLDVTPQRPTSASAMPSASKSITNTVPYTDISTDFYKVSDLKYGFDHPVVVSLPAIPQLPQSEPQLPVSSISPAALPAIVATTETTPPPPVPRRKKVSRLLKSDENFMYATFKIKPKGGLTPRKPRKKRKSSDVTSRDCVGSTTKKKLQESILSGGPGGLNGDQHPGSLMSWKFHEQYAKLPANVTSQDKLQTSGTTFCTVSKSLASTVSPQVCDTCGNIFHDQIAHLPEMKSQRQCLQCVLSVGDQQRKGLEDEKSSLRFHENPRSISSFCLPRDALTSKAAKQYQQTSEIGASNPVLRESLTYFARSSKEVTPENSVNLTDMRTARCMTCGQDFHKFYSDPRGSCDQCLSVAPRVISSSKLFALTESPTNPVAISSQPLCSFSVPPSASGLNASSSGFSLSLPASLIVSPTSLSSKTSTKAVAPQSSENLLELIPSVAATTTTNATVSVNTAKPAAALLLPAPTNAMVLLSQRAVNLYTGTADSAHVTSKSPLAVVSSSSQPSSLSSSSLFLSSVSTVKQSPKSFVNSTVGDLASSKAKLGRVLEKQAQRAKVSGKNLFCSLCATEFTKICDYLKHVREAHDSKTRGHTCNSDDISMSTSASNISSGLCAVTTSAVKHLTKTSKPKRSLAHKTLACPVEDCPHFFREQKEMGAHFIRNHPSLRLCPYHECTFNSCLSQDLENHIRCKHTEDMGSCNSDAKTNNSDNSTRVEQIGDPNCSMKNSNISGLGPNQAAFMTQSDGSVRVVTSSVETADKNKLAICDIKISSPEQTELCHDSNLHTVESQVTGNSPNQNHLLSEDHEAEYSQSTNEKPLQCKLCDYRCRQKNALNWHMRKHPEAATQYRKYGVILE